MKISENEIQKILESGSFLIEKGYVVACNEYDISYTKDGILFKIAFEPYSDISSVSIWFRENNKEFNIGWIAFVRENIRTNPHERLANAVILLNYINNNYHDVSNYEFCEESEKMVDDFILKRHSNTTKQS